MTDSVQARYQSWLHNPLLNDDERFQLSQLDAASIADCFGPPPAFGTAGLRTPGGLGTSRLNRHTAAWTARALGARLAARGPDFAARGVCIGYDARHGSAELAHAAADALCGMGIPVYLFSKPRPTPELSFAVRALDAAAGICMTASHNPPQYIGLKVYWQGGAQIDDALAGEIAGEMTRSDVLAPTPPPLCGITPLGHDMDERFIASALRCIQGRSDIAACPDLSIVYTPFHGVGGAVVPEALKRAGLTSVHCVSEQLEPDGDFPTTPDPNPENPDGFGPALTLAEKVRADLILANDPDADRIAVWARDDSGAMRPLTGNQVGVLLTDFLLQKASPQDVILKTLVSTDMARLAAERRGCRCIDTFTGFKHLAAEAERLRQSGLRPVLAFEEAIGYMLNPDIHDKDGVSAALVIASMACGLRARGLTLHDRLDELGRELGFHAERTASVTLPGAVGQDAIRGSLDSLRRSPPAVISGRAVLRTDDFLCCISRAADGTQLPLSPCGADVLRFVLSDGCTVVIRPSGTEPKIKLYALARGQTQQQALDSAQVCAQDALHTLRLEHYTGTRSVKIL